jgi:HNH endonuclease
MCIYCGTTKYRKIYESHFGPIPKEENGRTYEIHHIDGNRKNNNLSNLKCVSIQEHYDIHYAQKDWAACMKIGAKMKISPDEFSKIASLNATIQNNKKVENGVHPFMTRKDGSNLSKDRIKNKTHNFIGLNKKRLENKTHNFIQKWKCIHCGKEGKNLALLKRWGHHNGECLNKRNDYIPPSTDHKIYNWINVISGERVTMTRTELKRTYNLRSQEIWRVINGHIKITHGWKLDII